MANSSLRRHHYESWLYHNQFFVSPVRLHNDDGWELSYSDSNNIFVYRKPDLSIAVATGAVSRVVSLGEVADPLRPELDNKATVTNLAGATNWSELETSLDDLTGRWVLIVTLGDETRIYHDAAGLRSVTYYVDATNGAVYAGSQPNLFRDLLGLERDAAVVAAYERGPVPLSSGWPGETTPIVGVRRLLPNHYLDFAAGRAVRYWPRGRIRRSRLEQTGDEVARLVTGAIAAAVRRREVWVPLSGGYDSRVVFACAKPFWDRLRFLSILHSRIPRYDLDIAEGLTRMAGREITTVEDRQPDDDLLATCRRNAGNMERDGHESTPYSLHRQLDLANRPDRPVFAFGHAAEVARCYWYSDGLHPTEVSVGDLCRKNQYDGNEIAARDYADWLSRFPENTGISVLDLFYWECRLGTWCAMHYCFHDTFVEPMPPFNCRRLLSSALGLDVKYRRHPYPLFRYVLNKTEPRTLHYPFNESRVRSVLRWPVRRLPVTWRSEIKRLGRSVLSPAGH